MEEEKIHYSYFVQHLHRNGIAASKTATRSMDNIYIKMAYLQQGQLQEVCITFLEQKLINAGFSHKTSILFISPQTETWHVEPRWPTLMELMITSDIQDNEF